MLLVMATVFTGGNAAILDLGGRSLDYGIRLGQDIQPVALKVWFTFVPAGRMPDYNACGERDWS